MPLDRRFDPSGDSPSVLVQIGQEIVFECLPDREPVRGVLFQTASNEFLGIFGDAWAFGKVDFLFDLYE